MSNFENAAYIAAPEIQIAIFCPQVLSSIGFFFNDERRNFGSVQYFQTANLYLNLARRQFRIFVASFHHLANCLDDKFPSDLYVTGTKRPVLFHVDYQWNQTVAHAHIDENNPSNIQSQFHPPD